MRIAMIATSRHPIAEPYAGGQESHTALLARELRRQGHFVRLYGVEGTDESMVDEVVPYVAHPALSALGERDPETPELGFLADLSAFTGAMVDVLARDDVDLVHNQSLHFLPLALTPAMRVPVITTLHTPPFPWMELGIALADPSASYVCVSEANARGWTTLRTPPQIILNGVEDDGLGEGSGGEDLVWMGRITPEKGTDLAIAAARAAGRRLRLIGPKSNAAWFDDVIAPLLGDDVVHLGHLPHAELVSVVRQCAAALVTPRWEEPFGLVAAEAAASGTPVVALDRGGLSEFITADMGVLVDPHADDVVVAGRMAEAVERAVALPRAVVRRTTLTDLGSARMAADYVDLYHQLVGVRRGAA